VRLDALILRRLAGLCGALGVARPAAAAPIELRDGPLLFVDDTAIASQHGVVRTFHPAHTRAAPVLQASVFNHP
jgi:hypothetical protein